MNDTIHGDRMRQLRLATHSTQTDLSRALHHESNTIISRLENGRGPASQDVIDDLCRRLDCSPAFLATPPDDVLATKPWLRAYADAPAKTVESIVADNALALEVLNRLQVQRIAESIPRFHGDPTDPDALEGHAHLVRSAAGLDEDGVVRNAIRAAERLGCVVLPLSDELGRHLGLSQYVDGVPHLRVSRPRPNVPGDRQRFTVAHELGHLSLHAHLGPPDTAEEARTIEMQAHRFAGAFLTPRDALIEDLHAIDSSGRVSLQTLQQLKSTWGVAIKMLVVRFQQIGVIEPAQATALYKQISKRGWNSGEPVHVGHEAPVWLGRALARHPVVDDMSTEANGIGATHFKRWLSWSPPGDESAVVLPLDTARRQKTVSSHRSASS